MTTPSPHPATILCLAIEKARADELHALQNHRKLPPYRVLSQIFLLHQVIEELEKRLRKEHTELIEQAEKTMANLMPEIFYQLKGYADEWTARKNTPPRASVDADDEDDALDDPMPKVYLLPHHFKGVATTPEEMTTLGYIIGYLTGLSYKPPKREFDEETGETHTYHATLNFGGNLILQHCFTLARIDYYLDRATADID